MLLVAAALAVDDAEIREHLLEVTATLRVETPDTLAPPVRARRLDALDALESYAWAGDFPDPGSGTPESRRSEPPRSFRPALPGPRVPDFVDAAGTHCAVGYLMALDSPALVASELASIMLDASALPPSTEPSSVPESSSLHATSPSSANTTNEERAII